MDQVIKPYPKFDAICKAIEGIKSQTRNLLKQNSNSIYIQHNIFTNYCATQLLHLSANRPVIDSFCYAHEIDHINQLLLINDKAVKENAEYRLVSLPDIACQQYSQYLIHLELLITKLRRMGDKQKILAHAIAPILSKEKQYTPQFFYLDENLEHTFSIHPNQIQDFLHKATWFPDNYGRHILSTSILEKTEQAQWAMIQLGHLESGVHPFGITSESIPLSLLAQIRQTLNEVTTEFGWEVIKTPFKDSKSSKTRRITKNELKKLKRVHKPAKFGPEARLEKRSVRLEKHKDVIRYALLHYRIYDRQGVIDPETDKLIQNKISEEAEINNLSPNYCLYFYYRWRQQRQFGGQWKSYFKRRFQVEKEFSPFKTDTLQNYKKILAARQNFLLHLENAYLDNIASHSSLRIAEIIISAGLFSYVSSKARLKDIIDALYNRLFRVNNHIFLDLKCIENPDDEDKNVFRWFPDTSSLPLILGFDKDTPRPTIEDIYKELREIFRKILPGLSGKDILVSFTKINDSALTIELPGYIVPVAKGTANSVSLPLNSFTRILSGKNLIQPKPKEKQATPIPYAWTFDVTKLKNQNTYFEAKSFQTGLRKAFNEAAKQLESGKQKTKLVTLTEKLLNSSSWGTTCQLIGTWVIHICNNRSRFNTNLVFSSIRRYTNIITRGLTKFAYDKPLTELSDLELEELYIKCALLSPAKRRADAISRLQEFHHFLDQYWTVDAPDWNTVYVEAECDNNKHLADANIITEAEYIRIIQGINRTQTLNEQTKYQYIFLLVLGFRFGLRYSEAYQLQYRDIQYDTELNTTAVSVHYNRYGGLKSRAGIRKIGAVLLKNLDPIEIDAIYSLVNYFETGFSLDHEIGLFARSISDTNLIDKSLTSIDLHLAIREATGDYNLRFHHLRHSWANRVSNKTEHYPQMTGDSPFLLTKHFVSSQFEFKHTPLSLKELTRVIGHASEETSIINYLHSLDSVLYEHTKSIELNVSAKSLSRALAYSLGITENSARKQIYRFKQDVHEFSSVRKLANAITLPNIELTEIDSNYIFEPSHQKLSDINLVKINEILLEAYKPGNNVGSKLLLDNEITEKVIRSAITIEKVSGYDRFQLYRRCIDIDETEYNLFSSFNNRTEEYRIIEILKRLDTQLPNLSDNEKVMLNKLIKLWTNGYEPDTNEVMVSSLDEIHDFYDACSLLLNDQFSLNISIPIENKEKIPKDHRKINYKEKRIKLAREKSQFYKKYRYLVSINLKNPHFKTIKTFQRILFYLSVLKGLQ